MDKIFAIIAFVIGFIFLILYLILLDSKYTKCKNIGGTFIYDQWTCIDVRNLNDKI